MGNLCKVNFKVKCMRYKFVLQIIVKFMRSEFHLKISNEILRKLFSYEIHMRNSWSHYIFIS